MSTYGDILDYRTGHPIRSATREDWSTAREQGEPHTGAYLDPETGISVYCDGPETDPTTEE